MTRALVTVLLFAAAVWLVLQPLDPPAPSRPARAGDFDSTRAFADLRQIAAVPRPPGTPAHDAVRDYLLAQLGAAGWQASVQETTWVRPEYTAFAAGYPVRAVRVQNVVARRAGSVTGESAVLLAAHYDSKTTTPGASDDGYGTAALLETARALAAGPPLQRDVILLFTDGEELGLFGAGAFVGAHPWQKEVGVVLNFEARGNAGPALLFETSGPDLELLRAAALTPHPVGNSLARSIYERMPNDTDFSDWRRVGTPGLNFANIGGFSRYHAPADTVANAQLDTLAHHGETALALARRLAQTPPNLPLAPDRGRAVYFDVAGLYFVVYPEAWSLGVTLAGAALLVLWMFALARKDATSPRKVGLALGTQLATLVGTVVLSVGTLVLIRALRPEAVTPAVRPSATLIYMLSFVGLALTGAGVATRVFAERVGVAERAAAGGFLWLFTTVILHRALPGGAYLFAWPLVGLAAAGWLATWSARPLWQLIALVAGGLPALVLLPEHAFQVAQAFGVLGGPAISIIAALLLLPQAAILALMTPRRGSWLVAGLGASLALLALTLATVLPLYDEGHPRPGTLLVAVDADRNLATWLSPDDAPAPWVATRVDATRVAQPDFFPLEPGRTFRTRAADPALVAASVALAPTATLVDDKALEGGGRRVRLRLAAPADTVALAIYVAPAARVVAASLDGAVLEQFPELGGFYLHYWGPPDAGSELSLDVAGGTPLSLRLVAQRVGFPAGVTIGRPAGDAAKPSMVLPPHQELMDSDTTLVTRSFAF